jgi:cytochrome c oxidase assembly factor 5
VLKQGKSPKECLSNKDNLPLQCQHLLASFSDCKRGLVSARPCTRSGCAGQWREAGARGSGNGVAGADGGGGRGRGETGKARKARP